jgi:hypothetical protein
MRRSLRRRFFAMRNIGKPGQTRASPGKPGQAKKPAVTKVRRVFLHHKQQLADESAKTRSY